MRRKSTVAKRLEKIIFYTIASVLLFAAAGFISLLYLVIWIIKGVLR